MVFQTKIAAPALPPRPRLRPSPPPHTARSLGHTSKFPGTRGMVADRLAGIMQSANGRQTAVGTIKTKAKRGSSAQNKENREIPLETAVELLGIKQEEEEGAQNVKLNNRTEVGEVHVEGRRHPLPERPTRNSDIGGPQLKLGGFIELKNQQSEELGVMIASTGLSERIWNLGANGMIGLQVPPALPMLTGCTYNTVTRICSGKYCGDTPCEGRPLPEPPVSRQLKTTPATTGYVVNSTREYLEDVANRYNQSFGKMGKVFIKVHSIDDLNLPKDRTSVETISNAGKKTDQYVYVVLECDGQTISSKRVAAEAGSIGIGEEFAFYVQAGCKLTVKLASAPHPTSFPTTGRFTSSTSTNFSAHPTAGTNQHPEGKESREVSKSVSTSSEAGSSGYSIPQMASSRSSIFSAGGSVAQTCLKLDESALARLSIPKSTAGFHQSWSLTRECLVPQEHVKPSSYEQKTASRSIRKQWQKLKKHSLISSSTGVSSLHDMDDNVSVTQRKEIVVGNVKASVVVWPYSGDWTPSGFDECVRILSCDGVSNLNKLVKGWTDHGNEWIVRNPKVDLTGILEAASVLGNLRVLGNASVRVAGSLFWKRRFFAVHPPHLLSLQISDQPPTDVHQAFNLRMCIAIEAPFDTPIQDIQDGLWHPPANAFRLCFRKSPMDFKEEEAVEFVVDSLTIAKEWVDLLRNIVGRLQQVEF